MSGPECLWLNYHFRVLFPVANVEYELYHTELFYVILTPSSHEKSSVYFGHIYLSGLFTMWHIRI